MKKLLIGCIIIVCFILTFLIINKDNNIAKSNFTENRQLTLLLETDINSNEYQVSNINTWPTDGYVFNEELSYCELGSTIIWNEENKTISLRTNISDKCFIYFDAATKEIRYVYKADLSRPYLIEEIISDNVDEILMFFFRI